MNEINIELFHTNDLNHFNATPVRARFLGGSLEMTRLLQTLTVTTISTLLLSGAATAFSAGDTPVPDELIAQQREALAANTNGVGFGPQSPRDLASAEGRNGRAFGTAPADTQMNLCDIHFHEGAEHKGGEFTTYVGNGDGHGFGTGYAYSGALSEAELAPLEEKIGASEYGDLVPGDTIEVHYVYSTAQVVPAPTLGSCLEGPVANPQLRVQAQVYVLVNDDSALDFVALNKTELKDGLYQAVNIPTDTGETVNYEGSTTGPSFNEAGSPFQVSWSVRPKVAKVNIKSVGVWLQDNVFAEDHAHGSRNLVTNPDLLSPMGD